jgi:atypical dual specificity phosphatase
MTEFDISEITPYLYISSFPSRENVERIRSLGIRLIVSMYLIRPHKILGEPPLKLLWMPVIDSRFTPIPLNIFKRGVQAALPVIDEGGKVLVHCRWGVHRSVAMACCILIAKGYPVSEATKLVKRQRAVADPDAGYVLARIKQFEQVWKR